MSGEERRSFIIQNIRDSEAPVSGSALARQCGVSRQVIVQDIALIRAAGYEVMSTHRGYVLQEPSSASRIFSVHHTDARMEEELNTIVDLGGCVENVMVRHKVYGTMEADLHIDSRRKAAGFLEEIRSGRSATLKTITSDYHYHKVTADSEETLDLIEEKLKEKGFLVEQQ